MFALTSDDASLLHRILQHRSGGAIGFSLLSSVPNCRFAQAMMQTIQRDISSIQYQQLQRRFWSWSWPDQLTIDSGAPRRMAAPSPSVDVPIECMNCPTPVKNKTKNCPRNDTPELIYLQCAYAKAAALRGTYIVQHGIGESGVEHAGVEMLFSEILPALNEAREIMESPSILIFVGFLFNMFIYMCREVWHPGPPYSRKQRSMSSKPRDHLTQLRSNSARNPRQCGPERGEPGVFAYCPAGNSTYAMPVRLPSATNSVF
jgi:hypothetical protein